MWKITFFFTMFNYSWTETYYASGGVSLQSLQTAAGAVAQSRAACMGPQAVITAIRFVFLATPRVSYYAALPTAGYVGNMGGLPGTDPDQDAAPQFVSAQVKFYNSLTYTSRRYLAGAPEFFVGTRISGRNVEPNIGLFTNALAGLVSALAAQAWSWRVRNTVPKALSGTPITNVQFPGEIGLPLGVQLITNASPQPFQVYLYGFRKVNYRQFGLAGVYTVDPSSPGITASAAPYTYYLRNTGNVLPANIAQTGFVTPLSYTYPVFQSTSGPNGNGFTLLSFNHRKRGVSALALRGRSRSKP